MKLLKYALPAFILGLLAMTISTSADETGVTAADGKTSVATFAGGCFWCMEGPFDKLQGVISTTSGYTGGHTENPTYKQTSSGKTGHTEAVQIIYKPEQVSYEKLLDVFWHNIDPTTPDQQFCDRGNQYRSEIFYHNDEQKELAESSKATLDKNKPFSEPVVTQISKASTFYAAEDYHQDYYKKNPLRYRYYRHGCGRDKRLEQLWGENDH
jgi:peptide-methionine (S)-S-oxide reductase